MLPMVLCNNVPGIFWRLCIDVVSPLLSHNIQGIFLLMIVHYLPADRKMISGLESFLSPLNKRHYFSLLGRADIDGSFQLLFAVVVKVHELRLAQNKPTHLPVAPRQGGHAPSFLVKPTGFDGVLLGPKPHEGLVLQDTPAATPRDHQAT